MSLFLPKYTIGTCPHRKQLALLKNIGNKSGAVAYFRNEKEAEEFQQWLEELLDKEPLDSKIFTRLSE